MKDDVFFHGSPLVKEYGDFMQYAECRRKISFELMREMKKRKPRAKVFIDLFGGTCAMTCMALEFGYDVQYNEFDDGIFTFTKRTIFNCYTPLTIDKYSAYKLPPEDWYDQTKQELYNFGVLPEDWFYLKLQLHNGGKGIVCGRLLFFGNQSYDEIDLTQFNNEKCIVYCDIRNLHNSPYHKYYNEDYVDFDYNKFEEWLKEQRNKGYDVFVSKYTQPKNTTEIWSITTQSNIGGAENKEEVKERLFVN